jgi:YVTN family beta-propeller protein
MARRNNLTPSNSGTAAAAIVETVAVTGSPNKLLMNRAGTRLYVTSATGSGSVTVLGTQPLRVIETIEGLGSPIWGAINDVASCLYVTDNSVATGTPLNVIETLNHTVIGRIDGFTTVNGIALNSTGTRLYVADHGASKLVAIDTSNYQRTAETAVGWAKDVVIAPDNTRAHIATDLDGWTIVELTNHTVVADIKAALGIPTSISHSPRYPRVYIAHRASGRVTVGDALVPDVSKEIRGLRGPWQIAFNRLSETAYITETDGGQISIIDTRLNLITGTIGGFEKPRGIVISPDGRNAYVADIGKTIVCRVRL